MAGAFGRTRRSAPYDDDGNGGDNVYRLSFMVNGLWFIVGAGFARPNVTQTTDLRINIGGW